MDITKDALQHLFEKAGERAFDHIDLPGSRIPLALVQTGYQVKSLEEHLPAPTRVKQSVFLKSPQALVAYVKRFSTPSTVVFVDDQTFVAKLDYHGPAGGELDGASWCTHTATYTPQHSHQWTSWLANNKKRLNQLAFADFLEERLGEIITPASAIVLTAILNFKEAAGHTLESVHNPRTSEITFKFVKENVRSEAQFPHDIRLSMPIFDYHESVVLDAEIRYATNSGVLTVWYQFKRDPIDIVREHFESISRGIQSELEAFPFFEGKLG